MKTTPREVIMIIGRKRFIALALLLIINGGLFYGWQKVLLPQQEMLEGQKRGAETERARLQREIVDLPAKYDQFKKNEARFISLRQQGLMNEQDRVEASRRIDLIRAKTGLAAADYSISPAAKIEHAQSYLMTDDIVRSKMEFTMRGLTDLDIRQFLNVMQTDFPGLLTIQEMSFDLKAEPSPQILTQIGQGDAVDLVEGRATLSWTNFVARPTENPQ
jgi:hypothetical protein